METGKIRIKDIAERAGVSVGTVDRVLHKRPNVSKSALEKVEKALAEAGFTILEQHEKNDWMAYVCALTR